MCEVYARYNDVVIRSWRAEDAESYYRAISDTEVMRYISGGKPRTLADAQREVANFIDEFATRGWSRFAVSVGVDGPFVGYVGFADKPDGIDFGGRSLREHWGKPYTTIGCWLAIDYGMTVLGFDSIYTANHVDNHRARRMTERLGFAFRRVVDTGLGPHNWLELTKRDYFAGIQLKNRMLIERLFGRDETASDMRIEAA